MKVRKRLWLAAVLAVLGTAGVAALNYDVIAIQLAPKKQRSSGRTEAALRADALFWATLHGGEYEKIPQVLDALKAAYLQDPGDSITAAHIGFAHTWRLTERVRLGAVSAAVADHAILARRYFEEALALDPSEARYLGFLASQVLAEGVIHQDERLTRRGYFMMLDAIDAWPEFNLFTAGYVMSRQPADSPEFRKALERQWQNLDACVDGKVDRRNIDFSRYLGLRTTQGRKRVCWNSWIAPHNFEGFFLNMGDMLVKAGDWRTAQKIYASARLSPDYAGWRFRGVLEERIRHAQRNVALFNAPEGAHEKPAVRMMVHSEFACMGCHQK